MIRGRGSTPRACWPGPRTPAGASATSPSSRTRVAGGSLHPARECQPSSGAVKGSKILWPHPPGLARRSRPSEPRQSQSILGVLRTRPLASPAPGSDRRQSGEAHQVGGRSHGSDHEPQRSLPGMRRGGLVPAPECTCSGTAHTCTPATCPAAPGPRPKIPLQAATADALARCSPDSPGFIRQLVRVSMRSAMPLASPQLRPVI
jgi:hypothetical protein